MIYNELKYIFQISEISVKINNSKFRKQTLHISQNRKIW